MKKTTPFEKAFLNLYEKKKKVKEEDEMSAAGDSSYSGGALGPNAGINTQGDFYAPGDYRKPFALGAVQTRRGTVKKRRRKNKKKK